MSQRKIDHRGRWRSLTIAFRVSPEENQSINTCAKLSGLTKQEYLIRRCQQRDVIVQGSPKVYKALRDELRTILVQLQQLETQNSMDADLLDTIRYVAAILGGMREEGRNQ